MFYKLFSILALGFLGLAFPAVSLAATLTLSPASGTVNRGCSFSVSIVLNTAGVQTDGTDAILFYQPAFLTATSVTSGTIYADYPGNAIDPSSGKITISGLASVSQAFSGQGTLATVNFSVPQAATLGPTTVNFDYDTSNPQKTTDSNVVERDSIQDVLQPPIGNATYTVGSGTCSGQTVTVIPPVGAPGVNPATPTQAPFATAPPLKQLPDSGIETPTLIFGIVGGLLVVVGVIGFALL